MFKIRFINQVQIRDKIKKVANNLNFPCIEMAAAEFAMS